MCATNENQKKWGQSSFFPDYALINRPKHTPFGIIGKVFEYSTDMWQNGYATNKG